LRAHRYGDPDQNPDDRPSSAYHERFDQELIHDLPPRRSNRLADPDLPRPFVTVTSMMFMIPIPLITSAMNAMMISTIVNASEIFFAAFRIAVSVSTLYSASAGCLASQQSAHPVPRRMEHLPPALLAHPTDAPLPFRCNTHEREGR